MDIQEIEVEIDAEGRVNLHVKGITGSDCLVITRGLEMALGNVILERIMTPEASPIMDPNPEQINNNKGIKI
jgi:hypothetical protein